MSEKAPVHVRVLRSHPDFAHHPGEITTLSRETVDKYAEIGPFFEEITAQEAKKAVHAFETATAPQDHETAALPLVADEVAHVTEKAAKTAHKTDKTPHK